MVIGITAALFQANDAEAAAAAPLNVLQLERYFEPDPLAQNVHGWHCRSRRGPYGWHRHRRACGDYYDDPYDDPYYNDPYYEGPAVVIRPRKRRRSRCTRRVRRSCYNRWRHNRGRLARCLRKYRC